jgi:chorismate synthase
MMSEFKATTWADIKSRYLSNVDEDRWFRMTTSYWEMLATIVNRGALHAELFFDHTGEDIVTWERIKTLIPDARADIRPTYLFQLEKLVLAHRRTARRRWPRRSRRRRSRARMAREEARCAPRSGRLGTRRAREAREAPVTCPPLRPPVPRHHVRGVARSRRGRARGRPAARARRGPEAIQHELDRRRPGQSAITTQRKEADQVEVLSGVYDGKSLGSPIAMLVRNSDMRSKDYDALKEVFRPGHADYATFAKYGVRDHRGGGRSSGRETVGRVAAGALAKAALATVGVQILGRHRARGHGGGARARLDAGGDEPRALPRRERRPVMQALIERTRDDKDSVGGVIEVVARGVPAGWGDPTMDKLDAALAAAMLSIPATKGVEIGGGFAMTAMKGSQTNDVFDGERYATNFAGGISGGISNGERDRGARGGAPRPRASASPR